MQSSFFSQCYHLFLIRFLTHFAFSSRVVYFSHLSCFPSIFSLRICFIHPAPTLLNNKHSFTNPFQTILVHEAISSLRKCCTFEQTIASFINIVVLRFSTNAHVPVYSSIQFCGWKLMQGGHGTSIRHALWRMQGECGCAAVRLSSANCPT